MHEYLLFYLNKYFVQYFNYLIRNFDYFLIILNLKINTVIHSFKFNKFII